MGRTTIKETISRLMKSTGVKKEYGLRRIDATGVQGVVNFRIGGNMLSTTMTVVAPSTATVVERQSSSLPVSPRVEEGLE